MIQNIIIPIIFKPLFHSSKRFILVHGGRGSAKSWSIAYKIILSASSGKRWVCARETKDSIDASVHALLADTINRCNIGGWIITSKDFTHESGGKIFFKGLKGSSLEDTKTRLKSIEGVDGLWVEEAQSLTKSFLDILIPTIRKSGSQQIFSFNRYLDPDAIYERFCQNPDKKTTLIINANYWDNKRLSKEELYEAEKMKEDDYELWLHIYGGEPISQHEKSILSRAEVIKAMDRSIEAEGQIQLGVDVARKGRDKTVIYMRKGHKVIYTIEYKKTKINEVVEYVKEICELAVKYLDEFDAEDFDPKEIPIKIDDTGLGGGVTDYLEDNGYNAIPVNNGERAMEPDRYPNAISEMWHTFEKIINTVDIPSHDTLKKELTSRLGRFDTKGRRAVESKDDYKKRGNPSPDHADALLLCFYEKQNGSDNVSTPIGW